VLGSGWGSLSFSSSVDTNKYDVKVISPRNYFLFSPLLSHGAVGKLHDFAIKETFRHALARADRADVQFAEAECTKIDPNAKTVTCRRSDGSMFEESYDKLVIAVGAAQNTFGVSGVHQYCNFFKNIEDAKKIHNKIISNIELASAPGLSNEERVRLMHIVVVGGSPVSVQLASELKSIFPQP
jgi:NADH:ubiquinone reductase (non-electrogenic)